MYLKIPPRISRMPRYFSALMKRSAICPAMKGAVYYCADRARDAQDPANLTAR
jgi:hypothetical protein